MPEPRETRDEQTVQQQFETTLRGVCPTGRTIRCWSHDAASFRRVRDRPRIHRPRQVSQAITCRLTPTPDSSAGDRCPQTDPGVHELGPERCAGQDEPVHPTVFPATSAWRRAACDRLAGRNRFALSILRTEYKQPVPVEKPATAYAMAGHFRCFEGVCEGRALEMQLKGGDGPHAHCRGR